MKISGNLTLTEFNLWTFGVIGKLMPCALLLLMSVLIVSKLHELEVGEAK